MALTIVQHPNASAVEKAFAGWYIATEGTAHVALAVGSSVLAWQAIAPAAAATEAACADGDCTNEVSVARNVAGNVANNATTAAQQVANYPTQPVLGLPQKVIEQLARAITQNPDSRAVGLGYFRGGQGYTAFAKRWGLSYLDMPSNLYASGKFDLFKGDFWLVNQQFLQNAINKGKIFILETPYSEALKYPQSNLYWEIDYLLRNGYVHVTVNGVDKLIPQ